MLLLNLVIPAEFSKITSAGNLPIIPPPTAAFSIMRPFNIPDSVFKATLKPQFPITAALLYVVAVVALNKYNRLRDTKPWPISTKPWFSKFVIMHNSLLAVYSAWTFCGMLVANGIPADSSALFRILILIKHVKMATTAALAGLILATTFADGKALQTTIGKHNDFSCQPSADHPRPVVLLHGLGATYYDDLHVLEAFLQSRGFCTFSLTYGALEGRPLLGGFAPIDKSSRQIADFIYEVHAKTAGRGGTRKIDLVGHSEGGFQSLYVPKFREGVAALVDHIVAIAPPTHGTPIANLLTLSPLLGRDAGLLELIGCAACHEISVGGASVAKLNDGKAIVQPGNKVSVIISGLDVLVIPPTTAFIYEDGVDNICVQDYCPLDLVGHISETYDVNIWNLVLNSLENQVGRKFPCLVGGLPIK
ncbi:hypothetical protein MY3296_002447 [Beauveria thailandica]